MDLAHHLRSWSPDELGRLLEARPDLLPATDRGLAALARKAATATSLGRVLVGADVGMLVVADALVATHPGTVEEIDDLLGTGDPLAVVEALERLRHRGVVVVDDGVAHPVGALTDLLHRPLGLGPSFVELAEHLPGDRLDRLAVDTRADGGGRSATIRAVARRLREAPVVAALLADAPAGTADLLDELTAHRSPAIGLPAGFSYRQPDPADPLGWLLDRGLVVAVTERGAELPRELVMAQNPDGLAPGAALRPVAVEAGVGIDAELAAGRAADRANRTLDGAESLLRLADRGEISVRRTGGVGPREIARLSRALGLDDVEIVRLLELLAAARLVQVDGTAVRSGRLAERWWTLARPRRFLALIRSWVGSERFLSQGIPDDGSGLEALGAVEPTAATSAARSVALATMTRVEPGQAWQIDELAAAIVWQAPNLWGPGEPPPERLVDWTVAEAELLGLVADDAPGPLLRALVAGDEDALSDVAAAAVTDDQTTIVLQGDLTALALGPLAPAVAEPLAQMTERETADDGATPTFRFTEASIRRAYDAGWTVETVTAFLADHALTGLPQPLEYLLADVDRRHGTATVMAAASVVVTDDDVGAVEIASHRRAGALGLRLIAPTVLVSPLDPVALTEGLRAAGFLPVLKGEAIEVGRRTGTVDDRAEPFDPLPADWIGPPLHLGPYPDEVADAVTALLTEDLDGLNLAGFEAADPAGRTGRGPADGGPDDPVAADAGGEPGTADDGASIATQLARAWGRPVRVRTGGGLEPIEVTGTLVGLGGALVSVLTTTGVVELPAGAVASVERLDRP